MLHATPRAGRINYHSAPVTQRARRLAASIGPSRTLRLPLGPGARAPEPGGKSCPIKFGVTRKLIMQRRGLELDRGSSQAPDVCARRRPQLSRFPVHESAHTLMGLEVREQLRARYL